MKDNKSPEVDGIPPKLLKEIIEPISTPLTKVSNLSLEERIFPLCKLLETLIRDHNVEFLEKHKLIHISQHGFLKARSYLTNIVCFFVRNSKMGNDESPLDVVYLDLQKAFIKVPNISVQNSQDIDRKMFFKHKEGSRTNGQNAALVNEQCRLDMRKYSFSQRVINEWNSLSNIVLMLININVLTKL